MWRQIRRDTIRCSGGTGSFPAVKMFPTEPGGGGIPASKRKALSEAAHNAQEDPINVLDSPKPWRPRWVLPTHPRKIIFRIFGSSGFESHVKKVLILLELNAEVFPAVVIVVF